MPLNHANGAGANQLKRLILCFDGTWNTPEDQTNVSRIYAAIADQHAGCGSQLKFYDPGVGTSTGSRLRGGVLGRGLNTILLEGYCWLINEYQSYTDTPILAPEEDGEVFDASPDIFIFGFSRGAYTARSLAGLINRCGLPKLERFGNERNRRAQPDSDRVSQAWDLYRKEFAKGVEARKECASFRNDHCRNVKVKFLGVWDTVGALGVPLVSRFILSRLNVFYGKSGFHDTDLGRVIEYAFHAVAIDEQREDYQVALWTDKHDVGTREVEQRWFPSAHSNVSGGYQDDLLPDPPLKWIAERALDRGLEFTDEFKIRLRQQPTCKNALPEDFKLRGDEYLSPVRDSYAEFLYGLCRVSRGLILKGRYHHPMLVSGIRETIDETAHMKWAADPTYRPQNFANAGRTDFRPGRRGTPVISTAAPAGAGNP